MPSSTGPYSRDVETGDLIIVSGRLGLFNGISAAGVAAPTEAVIANLVKRIAEVGTTLSNVVKTTCFLAAVATFLEFNGP